MNAVFLKILNMSITAGLLVPAVMLLRLLLGKAPKWTHCALWALVAIRLLLPFSVESDLSLLPSAEPLPLDILSAEPVRNADSIPADTPPLAEQFPEDSTLILPAETPQTLRQTLLHAAPVLWIAGTAGMLLYIGISYLRIRRRTREAIPLTKGVFLCDRIASPFILGTVHPGIYLPADTDGADTEYILSHERAHLKRGDHLWKPLGFLLLSLHWFNPVLWLAYVLLCRDIEYACDEKVIAELGTASKKPYADALIRASVPRSIIAACPLAFGEVNVKHRVTSVLHYKKPTVWILAAALIAGAVLSVGFLTDPANPKIDGHVWGFSHLEMDGETVYCTPSQSVLHPDAAPISLTAEMQNGVLCLTRPATGESRFFACDGLKSSRKTAVYRLTSEDTEGFAVLNRTKAYKSDLVGQMLIMREEDLGLSASFSLPNRDETTLILSFDKYTLYFSDRLETETEPAPPAEETGNDPDAAAMPFSFNWSKANVITLSTIPNLPDAVTDYALDILSAAADDYDTRFASVASTDRYRIYTAALADLPKIAGFTWDTGGVYVYSMEYRLLTKRTDIRTLTEWWEENDWSDHTGPYLALLWETDGQEESWTRLGTIGKPGACTSTECLAAAVDMYKQHSGMNGAAVCSTAGHLYHLTCLGSPAEESHEFLCLRCGETAPVSPETAAAAGMDRVLAVPKNGLHRQYVQCRFCSYPIRFGEDWPCASAAGEKDCVYCAQ